MGKPVKTHPNKIRKIEQAETALKLRISGATYEQIAQQLEVTRSRAYAVVSNALALRREECEELSLELRLIEAERLNDLQLRLKSQMTDEQGLINPPVVGLLLKVMERRAKMFGLDTPPTIHVHNINPRSDSATNYTDWATEDLETLQSLHLKYKPAEIHNVEAETTTIDSDTLSDSEEPQ